MTKYIFVFQEFTNMSKINYMKKAIEDLNVFRKYFRYDNKLVIKFKQVFLLLKTSFKLLLKLIYLVRKKRNIIFWFNGDELKKLLTMNPMEKQIIKIKTTSENMTKCLIKHKSVST